MTKTKLQLTDTEAGNEGQGDADRVSHNPNAVIVVR